LIKTGCTVFYKSDNNRNIDKGGLLKGYVQIYTGNGKGKTTAALGLSLRAAGAGLKVFIAQFLKKGVYSELKALKRFSDLITIEQYGSHGFIRNATPGDDHIKSSLQGIESVKKHLFSGKYDVFVIEEGNVAVKYGLFPVKDLIDIINNKPDHTELIITGRYAHPDVIAKADLVTEMKEIKHYYKKGVTARTGIEK
jgi:cob(I)alamin adenosyltransferase